MAFSNIQTDKPWERAVRELAESRKLIASGLLAQEQLAALANQAAADCIRYYDETRGYLREAITLICEIATLRDAAKAQVGLTALFPELVERLNDSFDSKYCRLYDQLFAHIITFCRQLPEGKEFDDRLRQFGLMNKADVLTRKAQLPTPNSQLPTPFRVLLLSRVTIGADVAVTSGIIAKLRQVMPQAEFVILGSRKLRELYGGDEKIRVREIAYERGGGLVARLASWLEVLQAVNKERRGLDKDKIWIVDPDSRLTQLGLLPLVENDHNYFFFESRSYPVNGKSKSIGQLAAHWAGKLIGSDEPAFPFVALFREYSDFGQRIAEQLRAETSCNRIVAISFGVGGNQSKRVSDQFEERLIRYLLTNSKVILDKGASAEERDQINRIVAGVRALGKTVVEFNEENKAAISNQTNRNWLQADVVTWDGSIGAFAGLIAASDQYIGYDSAGQHIAAALGVATLTVFVNSNSATFAERWRPFGKGKIEVATFQTTDFPF